MTVFVVDQFLEERKGSKFLGEFSSIEMVESYLELNYPEQYPIRYKNEPPIPYIWVRIASKKGILAATTYCYFGR